MTFAELALFILGVSTALQAVFYMIDSRECSADYAYCVGRNVGTFSLVVFAVGAIKLGSDVWGILQSFFVH